MDRTHGGEANEESDVDLLADLDDEKEVGWKFFGWNDKLKNVFKSKVDVVSLKRFSTFLAPFIYKDKKLIYAK